MSTIRNKPPSKAYDDNYDRIFRNRPKVRDPQYQQRVEKSGKIRRQEQEEMEADEEISDFLKGRSD